MNIPKMSIYKLLPLSASSSASDVALVVRTLLRWRSMLKFATLAEYSASSKYFDHNKIKQLKYVNFM